MEDRNRIAENALDQLIIRTLYDLEQSDSAAKEAEAKLSMLYDSLCFDGTLDKALQERVRQYIEQTIVAANIGFRHIYLQGAKDSVTVMRELGIIK